MAVFLGFEKALLAYALPRRLLTGVEEPDYQRIIQHPGIDVAPTSCCELHLLTCERDVLRTLWSLHSFYRYSGLRPQLVLHNDGSLTSRSKQLLRNHFQSARMTDLPDYDVLLSDYPTIRFYRKNHVLARKLIDVLLSARQPYIIVMDSDVLWFRQSSQIASCVAGSRPFYLPGLRDSYARNTRYLKEKLDLHPAVAVNTGVIGFQVQHFLDLTFIETALNKILYIPVEDIPSSIGFPIPAAVKAGTSESLESVSWWVLEQTIYALLFGRLREYERLQVMDCAHSSELHQFVNMKLSDKTVFQHYVLDSHWNAQFPVGVHELMERGFFADA